MLNLLATLSILTCPAALTLLLLLRVLAKDVRVVEGINHVPLAPYNVNGIMHKEVPKEKDGIARLELNALQHLP
jgi:hypothetical protein